MKTILLASIRDNDETKRIRCPLVLVETTPNLYKWHDIGYDGSLEPVENAPIASSIEQAIKDAKSIWKGPAWDLIIAPNSLIDALEQQWQGQTTEENNLADLGAITRVDSTQDGDNLWYFPDALAPFWVVEGHTGECFVTHDKKTNWDHNVPGIIAKLEKEAK